MEERQKRENHYLTIFLLNITILLWMLGLAIKDWYIYSILISIMCIGIYLFYIKLERQVKKWEKVEGKYKKYFIQTLTVWDGGRNLNTRYRPYFFYEYTINQKIYRNNILSILNEDYAKWEEEKARKLVSINRKNKTLTVYYNPENPAESVLLPTFSSGTRFELYIFLFFGITLLFRVIWHLYVE